MGDNEQIPQVETHDFFPVFATYGQTMGYVQSFEATVKLIVCLYNFFETDKAGPIDEEAFERIFTEHDRSTLGRVLNGLESRMGQVEANVKETALVMLKQLTCARNDLAHSYLVRKETYMKHPEGRSLVIAQLRNYSANFKVATLAFRDLLDHLLNAFIGPKEFREAIGSLWDQALQEAMETTGLKYFREKLQAEGMLK